MKPITYLGNLYLIPTTLGEINTDEVLPITIKRTIDFVWDYIVENEKTARKFIKSINPEKKQSDLRINVLDKHNKNEDNLVFLQPCLEGRNVGLMSEAGCPGIADPGAAIVKVAHQKGIKVIPLVGPSSILLAMMSSGMNGQNFAFNGYLPIDKDEKKQRLKKLEKLSETHNQSQIFIETPYRNNKFLEDLTLFLHPNTLLCVAADITLPTEYIKTLPIAQWKKEKIDLHNKPCIFIIHK